MAKNKELTPEQQVRRDRRNFRIFILLVLVCIFLVGYLVYEIISVFASNGTQVEIPASAAEIHNLIKLLK